MTTVEVLRAARAKIEQGWTQAAMARSSDYHYVAADSEQATCWCSLGAINVASDSIWVAEAALNALCDANQIKRITWWNDAPGRTQSDVLAAFDKAIALAESEAP